MRSLISALLFLFVLGASTTAAADDYSPKFESVEGKLSNGQLVLQYEVSTKSWQRLEDLKIKPKLNLYEVRGKKDKFLDTQTLSSRKGSFTFSKKKVSLNNGDHVKVRIHGSGGKHRITAWHLGGMSGKELDFTIRNGQLVSGTSTEPQIEPASNPTSEPTAKPDAPKGWRAAVVNACDEHAYVSSEKGECVELAVKIEPRWAADTVEACNEYGYVKSEINECLEVAADHKKFNPAETAEACEEHSYVSRDFLQCMKATAKYKAKPATLLSACSEAVYTQREKMDCFRFAADLTASDATVLQACNGRDWKKCTKAATGR